MTLFNSIHENDYDPTNAPTDHESCRTDPSDVVCLSLPYGSSFLYIPSNILPLGYVKLPLPEI
eukprot:CAMPEP_0168200026 /NCGR_PEP_ID=MMETSP0139_2-20121125/22805_1 /TAXON_ID=44445 /ORGANISM="Pseudo-nitzschia australis, Strain 10249 10 AB" /LENGTH=62 /DNA_ID=CAMNT_0008125191 /DNA_START=167 /DNA_END=355 /DNA_ORIENTATION=-